jgi:lysophospholipase L1-like esterase
VTSAAVLSETLYTGSLASRAIGNGVDLRILPIGNSITDGYKSTTNNGYRLSLQNLIVGNSVDYVGTHRSGSMPDNFNEGHSGAVISEIASYAEGSLPVRPNVVLLMAGTNDINKPNDPAGAPSRLASLIDRIFAACPDAAIVVAQITPINNSGNEALALTFNQAVIRLVNERFVAGKHILFINMHDYVTVSDLADGLHPNEYGYSQIARA